MYYVFEYDSWSENEAQILARPQTPELEYMRFNKGEIESNPPTSIEFNMTSAEKGELGDYVLTSLPGLVISKPVRDILDRCGADNIQYIPVVIHDEPEKKTHDGYFMANIIGVVDCIDLQKSVITTRAAMPDKIREIHKLCIDESRAKGFRILRLARRQVIVLVDETIKNALESQALRGIILIPVGDYST